MISYEEEFKSGSFVFIHAYSLAFIHSSINKYELSFIQKNGVIIVVVLVILLFHYPGAFS